MNPMEKFLANLKRLLEPRARPPDESIGQPTADRPPPVGSAPFPEPSPLDVEPTVDVGSEVQTSFEPTPTLPPVSNKETVEVPTTTPERVGDALILTLAAPVASFTVARSGATLGRGQENTIRLEDFSVSRRHARIAYRQGGYWLSDLGSMGGTWIDGAKLNAPRRIASGQIIDIGVCRLMASFAADPAVQGRRRR